MKKSNRKGFTIVELVIVIAVIAILAAVLIPTFSNLIKKANLSADQQAVRQMNTLLATEECANISDAIKLFAANGLDLEAYKPITADHYFYFVNGRVILADKDGNVLYPAGANADGQWMSLSGEVPMDDSYTVADDGDVSISSGAQFVHLMDTFASGGFTTADVLNITITSDIDLKGSTINFGKVDKNITLVSDGKVIAGLRADTNAFTGTHEGEDKSYGFALFGSVEANTTVTVQNINFSNVIIQDTTDGQSGHAGLIAGSVYGELVVKNVTIDNCYVEGSDKGGIIAGYLSGEKARIELENVTVTNSIVAADWYVAKAVGAVSKTAVSISITNCDFSGVTTMLRDEESSYEIEGRIVYTDEAGNKYLCCLGVTAGGVTNVAYSLTTNANYWRSGLSDGSITVSGNTYGTYLPMNDSWSSSN